MKAIRDRATYANVMATLAVFIALGGASYAAITVPPKSVGTKQLKKDAVGTKQLKKPSVGARVLKDASVGATKLQPNAVGPESLQGNAVGFDQLAPQSVDGDKVKDGSLGYVDLDREAVSPRLFAHVSSSGVLGEQGGVVSAARISKGQYEVTFDRELRGCVAVATVGFGFGPGVIGAGATAQARMNLNNDPRKIGVTIYRGGYTFNDVDDSDFHLVVAC